MATVLRVKRRLEENPQDALVLVCKRIKTDVEEISPSLFVFRATVINQETAHVKKILPIKDQRLQSAPNVSDILDKVRKDHKEASSESRYEVVNCSRGLKEESGAGTDDLFNLVDLQKKADKESDETYAYDLYTSLKQDFDISLIDNLVGVEADLLPGSWRDNGRKTPSDTADDDDDSNDENNWRNEYPDSEPSSIDEEDMIRAMERVDIDDLSSDAGEDKIYDDPPDLLNDDVKRYGAAYAQYKAKVLSENPDLSDSRNFVHCTTVKDLDEESVEGYKNDSDDGFYYGEDGDTEQYKEQYRSESPDEHSD